MEEVSCLLVWVAAWYSVLVSPLCYSLVPVKMRPGRAVKDVVDEYRHSSNGIQASEGDHDNCVTKESGTHLVQALRRLPVWGPVDRHSGQVLSLGGKYLTQW